jgi:hypothetical protein
MIKLATVSVTPQQIVEMFAGCSMPVSRLRITRGNQVRDEMIQNGIERNFLCETENGLDYTPEFRQKYVDTGPTVA